MSPTKRQNGHTPETAVVAAEQQEINFWNLVEVAILCPVLRGIDEVDALERTLQEYYDCLADDDTGGEGTDPRVLLGLARVLLWQWLVLGADDAAASEALESLSHIDVDTEYYAEACALRAHFHLALGDIESADRVLGYVPANAAFNPGVLLAIAIRHLMEFSCAFLEDASYTAYLYSSVFSHPESRDSHPLVNAARLAARYVRDLRDAGELLAALLESDMRAHNSGEAWGDAQSENADPEDTADEPAKVLLESGDETADPIVYYTKNPMSHYHYTLDGCRTFQHGAAKSWVSDVLTGRESSVRKIRELCNNCRGNRNFSCYCNCGSGMLKRN